MKVDRKYEKSFFNFLIFYRTPKLVLLDKKNWAGLIRKTIKHALCLSNPDLIALTLNFV